MSAGVLGSGLAVWAGCVLLAAAYRSGPPPGYTGGPGDESCHYCHYEFDLAPPGGTLGVSGFPETFVPGADYAVEIVLRHDGMGAAGFQLAIRYASGPEAGASAGAIQPSDARSAVVTDADRKVAFAQHVLEGTTLDGPGEARWRLRWTAPLSDSAAVVLAVAANAADGDESQMGDRVYTATRRSRPVTR